jgi:hypothetical protein
MDGWMDVDGWMASLNTPLPLKVSHVNDWKVSIGL